MRTVLIAAAIAASIQAQPVRRPAPPVVTPVVVETDLACTLEMRLLNDPFDRNIRVNNDHERLSLIFLMMSSLSSLVGFFCIALTRSTFT